MIDTDVVPLTVDEFQIADPADAWRAAGFSVDADGVCRIGDVRIRLLGPSSDAGILGWTLRDLPADGAVDGIPTLRSDTDPAAPAAHANGVTSIDHVVL